MANPFAGLTPAAPTTPRAPRPPAPPQPLDPDALYKSLLAAAATSRNKGQFIQQHQDELSQLAPAARQTVINSAGLGLPADTVAKSLSSGSYLNTQIQKAAHDVEGIPGGLIHAATQNPVKTAKEIGTGIVETVKHPGRDLFQTLTLASSAATAPFSIASRIAAVGDVVKGADAADLASAVGRLSKTESRAYRVLADPKKHLPAIDEPTARLVASPTPRLQRVLDLDPHLAAMRQETVKALGEGKVKPAPVQGVRKVGVAARAAGNTKAAQVAKAAVKTPLPKQRTLTVPGENGRPAITVHPVASKNPLVNAVERHVVDRARQRSLNSGRPVPEMSTVTGQRVVDTAARAASATTKVGRELRAARAVNDALELAPVSRLDRFAPSASARVVTTVTRGRVNRPTLLPARLGGARLSAAEQKAVDIKAAGATPATVIRYHQNLIARGVGKAGGHHVQIALAKAAEPHFQALAGGKAPKLAQAVNETRAVIQKGEQLKGMSPEEIAHRVGARLADYQAIARGGESPLEELQRLEHQLSAVGNDTPLRDSIQGRIDELHGEFTRAGAHAIEKGAFYLPSAEKGGVFYRAKVPATKQPSMYGLGPQGAHPALAHTFTGGYQRAGVQRSDATRLASQSYKQAQRYATLERGYRQLLAAAKDTREAAGGPRFAVPIRTTVSVPKRLKQLLSQQEVGTLGRDEIRNLSQGDVEALAKAMFPEEKELENLDGVKWIDSRLLGGIKGNGPSFAGSAGSVLDTVNAPFRASLLYTKPAYALNLLQALGTNAIQQGVFAPVNLTRALKLGKALGAEDQHAIFSLVGSGLSRSLEPTAGLGAKAIHTAGEFWNTIIDRYPRVASFLHEARREGFNTPAKIHALLNDERMRDKLTEVTRRANKEAIEYGHLSPFEQNVLRRALFFYPWIRGATLYSLRFPKEHPYQAAAATQVGGEGHKQYVKAFGPFAEFAPGMSTLVPVGKHRAANLANLNTFQTPIDVGKAIVNPTKLPSELSPVAAAIYTALTNKTTLGGSLPETSSPYGAALKSLYQLPAPIQLLTRSKPAPPSDKVSKQPTFPKGPQAAVERFVGGSAFPQPVNKPALAAKGEAAYKAGLGPEAKAKFTGQQALQQARTDATALHKQGVLPSAQLPGVVEQALKLDEARKVGYAQAAKQKGVPVTYLTPADKAEVVAKVAAAAKTAAPAQVASLKRLIAHEPDPKRQSTILAMFWRIYGKGDALSAWRTYVSHHKGG